MADTPAPAPAPAPAPQVQTPTIAVGFVLNELQKPEKEGVFAAIPKTLRDAIVNSLKPLENMPKNGVAMQEGEKLGEFQIPFDPLLEGMFKVSKATDAQINDARTGFANLYNSIVDQKALDAQEAAKRAEGNERMEEAAGPGAGTGTVGGAAVALPTYITLQQAIDTLNHVQQNADQYKLTPDAMKAYADKVRAAIAQEGFTFVDQDNNPMVNADGKSILFSGKSMPGAASIQVPTTLLTDPINKLNLTTVEEARLSNQVLGGQLAGKEVTTSGITTGGLLKTFNLSAMALGMENQLYENGFPRTDFDPEQGTPAMAAILGSINETLIKNNLLVGGDKLRISTDLIKEAVTNAATAGKISTEIKDEFIKTLESQASGAPVKTSALDAATMSAVEQLRLAVNQPTDVGAVARPGGDGVFRA